MCQGFIGAHLGVCGRLSGDPSDIYNTMQKIKELSLPQTYMFIILVKYGCKENRVIQGQLISDICSLARASWRLYWFSPLRNWSEDWSRVKAPIFIVGFNLRITGSAKAPSRDKSVRVLKMADALSDWALFKRLLLNVSMRGATW